MNILKLKIVKIFLVILITILKPSKAFLNPKIRSVTHRWNPKYFSNFTIYAQNSTIFCDLNIIKTLETGFKANIEFQLRLQNSKKYQTLFGYTLDICNMVITFKDTIFKRWFKSLLRYGNFMQNCPVNVGHYYLNGWKLDPTLIPSYLHPGDYRIKGYAFYGKFKGKCEDFVIELIIDTVVNAN